MTYGQRFNAVVIFFLVIFVCVFAVPRACAYECDEIHDRDLRLACVAQVRHDTHACEEIDDHDMRSLCRHAVICKGNRGCLMRVKHKGD